ncbi:uncharacterized protein [Aegilops tauschii subsp. strangulata]|uniref:uncharacterized protein n=1 Tax=Aegilops tauschii subsp. strangulata TaxID=200361 RepID=UPI00098A9E9F
MKKTNHFEWNDKVDEAFLQLKKMLTTPPVLAAPAAKEPMFLYIATTSRVVNTVISPGDWDAKDGNMASYDFLVLQVSEYFDACEFLQSDPTRGLQQPAWGLRQVARGL